MMTGNMLDIYYKKKGIEDAYKVFRSKGFSPSWTIGGENKQRLSMEDLSPFLRTLLVTDGTVTTSLAAYHWEPITVDTISQEVKQTSADIDWLSLGSGQDVLARKVRLRGANTGRIYVRAFSVICLSLIPEELRSQLLAQKLGIGELIRDCGLETYRELCEFGMADSLSSFNGPEDTNSAHIYRTYRIMLNNRPTILVTEFFPLNMYTKPQSA